MSLYSEYESYVIKYKEEYGNNTIVLYRCGSFYEIYSIDDGLVDMKRICSLLNIQISKRNKNISEVNRNNTLMAGFPMYALQKFVDILISENFTVVIVDQVSDPPKPNRAVTAIISPGTEIINLQEAEANNLICICIEKNIDFKTKKELLTLGLSSVDLSTGKNKVYEITSPANDSSYAIDEVYSFIQSENPKEICIIGHRLDGIINYLEISDKCVHEKYISHDSDLYNISYQTTILKRCFRTMVYCQYWSI